MKKIFLIFCVAVAVEYTCYYIHKGNYSKNLLLRNVEALAADESSVPVNCMLSGTVDCPHTFEKVKYVMEGYRLEYLY